MLTSGGAGGLWFEACCDFLSYTGPRNGVLHWLAHVIFSTESARATLLQRGDADEASAAPLHSKVALADSVEDPLEASPLCSKVALADSVEDPLEASPLCSPDSSGVPRAPSPLPPSGLRAKEEEAVMRGAPAQSRDYTESAFLEAGVLAPWGCLVAN